MPPNTLPPCVLAIAIIADKTTMPTIPTLMRAFFLDDVKADDDDDDDNDDAAVDDMLRLFVCKSIV